MAVSVIYAMEDFTVKNSEDMYIFYQPHNLPSPANQLIVICV